MPERIDIGPLITQGILSTLLTIWYRLVMDMVPVRNKRLVLHPWGNYRVLSIVTLAYGGKLVMNVSWLE